MSKSNLDLLSVSSTEEVIESSVPDDIVGNDGEEVEVVDTESEEDDCSEDLLANRTRPVLNNKINTHTPSGLSSSSSESEEEVHLHRDFECVKVPKRYYTESEKAKKSLKASSDKWEAKYYEYKSKHAIKEMEYNNMKTMKNDVVKEMTGIKCTLATSQAEKAHFKSDLSFSKKKLENFDKLQKERNVLKEERDAAVIELDFVKKYYIQAHNQVDYLLKSKDQMGSMILKHTLSSQQQEYVNYNKIRVIELQDKAKEKNRARFCNSLQKSASNGEKVNRHANCNSSVASGRAERVARYDHQDLPSLHDKGESLSHVTPENRSGVKHSGLPTPEDLFGKKVSHKKKAHTPRGNDSVFGTNNVEHEQCDNVHVGQERDTIIGENVHYYDTFSTTDFSREFSSL